MNATYQMEYILSILKLIRLSVDLGYNTLDCNIRILKTLPNIFYAMVLKAENRKDNSGAAIFSFQFESLFKENLDRIT